MAKKEPRSYSAFDKHRLDEEWEKQPRMVEEVVKKLADARRDHDEKKAELEVVVAELDFAIRSNPGKYGLEKITESAIKTIIPSRKKYKEAHNAVLDAKHLVDVLSGAMTVLEHRKRALENEVTLHLANYFSSPRKTRVKVRTRDDED
jgi:hypothetical protein